MDTLITKESETSGGRQKPKLPMKLVKPMCENADNRRTYVKDIVRRLQERQKSEDNTKRFVIKSRRVEPEDSGSSNQTLEDLKAIDEDIEKLRKQIEERDKIISALREAAEAKDKKLDQLMTDYSKLQMERAEPECRASLNGDARVQERNLTAFSTSPSPPLCNGELCWTDGFVNKNYHEPVYAQLLNDHTALQKIYNELREKLESKTKELEEDENRNFSKKPETYENGINLIMAEQIRILKEREAQLMSEAEELREQNDLMEFRILELEECRKEEMINEHKHRNEKNMWSERDLEEVSDSGVMSLPTSEDLTSDSELGDMIKNHLHTDNVIVPTLFPQVQIGCNENSPSDFKLKKILRNAECLQESGIFDDSEVSESNSLVGESSTKHTKACQTESLLDKTLLDIIDSSCDLILSKNKNYLADKYRAQKSDDLTTEISKLSEIQKRIEEKRENVSEFPKAKFQQRPTPCTHSNSIVFYEERLKQLEDKLKIYESSGDTKDVLLRKRLEKEVELSHKVKELTERVISLECINKQIEEEKCEFEEAENDSRFQCQRLEIKVQELMDKNSELEIELERHKMMMAGDRVDGNRRKNLKTKEKVNSDVGLSIIDAAVPGIIARNMLFLNQTKEEISEHLHSEAMLLDEKDPMEFCKSIAYPDGEVFKKLEELINDQKNLRIEYERAEREGKKTEEALKRKIEELEGKSARDREIIEEMTSYLKSLRVDGIASRNASTDSVPSASDFEMFEELKQLAENEKKMRRQIDTLERKEQAYLQTLQQADEIWAGMEEEYKKKLSEAEEYGSKLRERVSELEEALGSKELMKRVDTLTLENEELKEKVKNLAGAELEGRVKTLENENSSLKNVIKTLSEELPLEKKKSESLAFEIEVCREQYIQDKLTIEQLGKDLEEKNKSLEKVEKDLRSQISDLTQELAAKSKELSSLDVTVAELKEEVETLENKVTELMAVLQSSRLESQEDSSSPVHGLTDPRFCTSPRSMSSLCEVMPDIPRKKVTQADCQDEFPASGSVEDSDSYLKNGLARTELPPISANRQESDRLPPKETASSETEVINETKLNSRESLANIEHVLPIAAFLFPLPENLTEIHLLILNPGPEIVRLASESYPKEKILVGYSNRCVLADETSPVGRAIETRTSQTDRSEYEIDISELKLNNSVLQNALDKMEEETRLKDLELLELKKTVSDIRREQQELEMQLTEQTNSNPVESKATEVDFSLVFGSTDQDDSSDDDDEFEDLECENSLGCDGDRTFESVDKKIVKKGRLSDSQAETKTVDVVQIFSPILIQHPEEVAPSMSNLQVALDNLQNKFRIKKSIFRALLEGFGEGSDLRSPSDKFELLIPDLERKRDLNRFEKLEDFSNDQTKIIESNGKRYACDYVNAPPDFSFETPITVTRKIGNNLLVEWDTEGKPPCVIGYEICVDGNVHHRVRSSTRNKALLTNMDFTKRNTISVYPVTVKGRSVRCASVILPEETPSTLY